MQPQGTLSIIKNLKAVWTPETGSDRSPIYCQEVGGEIDRKVTITLIQEPRITKD